MANSALIEGRASGKSEGTPELPKHKTRGAQGAQSNQELKPKGLVPDDPEKGCMQVGPAQGIVFSQTGDRHA